MNHNAQNNETQDLSLANLTGSSVVTSEQYRRNREQFALARATLERMEQENEMGYAQWVHTVQHLERRVEEGRQAE